MGEFIEKLATRSCSPRPQDAFERILRSELLQVYDDAVRRVVEARSHHVGQTNEILNPLLVSNGCMAGTKVEASERP